MWTTSKPCYTEKSMLKMLKEASMEQLVEFLLQLPRKAVTDNAVKTSW